MGEVSSSAACSSAFVSHIKSVLVSQCPRDVCACFYRVKNQVSALRECSGDSFRVLDITKHEHRGSPLDLDCTISFVLHSLPIILARIFFVTLSHSVTVLGFAYSDFISSLYSFRFFLNFVFASEDRLSEPAPTWLRNCPYRSMRRKGHSAVVALLIHHHPEPPEWILTYSIGFMPNCVFKNSLEYF